MFKSKPAETTDDVYLRIDMGVNTKTMSIYMSLDETDPKQHIGMVVWIGGGSIETSSVVFTSTTETYSRWIVCGRRIGRYILITMPVIGKSLNIIEVMAY
jgi:hypothetical protein